MKKLNIDKPSEILQKAFDDVCTKSKQVGLSIMFIQEWDTPALGFLGVAAAEDTVAYTTIFTDLDPNSTTCYVYFDGRYAYTVYQPNQQFVDDVAKYKVGSVLYRSDYETINEVADEQDSSDPDQ